MSDDKYTQEQQNRTCSYSYITVSAETESVKDANQVIDYKVHSEKKYNEQIDRATFLRASKLNW